MVEPQYGFELCKIAMQIKRVALQYSRVVVGQDCVHSSLVLVVSKVVPHVREIVSLVGKQSISLQHYDKLKVF